MTVRPADRERFARCAAIEAITARLDQAYAAQQAASRDIKWLTELLITRSAQIRSGEWPQPADPDCQECGFRLPRHDTECSLAGGGKP